MRSSGVSADNPTDGSQAANPSRIQRDQRTDERAIVANNYRMLHNRTFHDLLFHRNRGDVLTAGSDDDVLLAAGDRTRVPRRRSAARSPVLSHPSGIGERFRGLLRQIYGSL